MSKDIAPSRPPVLWIAPDPACSVVLDESGGNALAALPLDEALRVVEAWWRAHHERFQREQEAVRRRQELRVVGHDR